MDSYNCEICKSNTFDKYKVSAHGEIKELFLCKRCAYHIEYIK